MSEAKSYYVYALKDPTTALASPFYIGKGTGIRAWEHELTPDSSSKGERIRRIHEKGQQVLTSKLVDGLTELEALRIEAELIAAFGTVSNGGMLTNAVVPNLNPKVRAGRGIITPVGTLERAQIGLELLKSAVLELATANSNGITNADVAHSLALQSDYLGGSKDYLSWSILGLLMREGRMVRGEKNRHRAQVR